MNYKDIGFINRIYIIIFVNYYEVQDPDCVDDLKYVEGRMCIFKEPYYENKSISELEDFKEFLRWFQPIRKSIYELKNK